MARKRYSDKDILKLLREIELKLIEGSDLQTTSTPFYLYNAASQLADGWAEGRLVEISQISASYGIGPAAHISLG